MYLQTITTSPGLWKEKEDKIAVKKKQNRRNIILAKQRIISQVSCNNRKYKENNLVFFIMVKRKKIQCEKNACSSNVNASQIVRNKAASAE